MKLCQKFSLVLVRTKQAPNNFFDDLFSENRVFRFFLGVIYTKISGFLSDGFYDKKIDFLRKEGRKLGNLE